MPWDEVEETTENPEDQRSETSSEESQSHEEGSSDPSDSEGTTSSQDGQDTEGQEGTSAVQFNHPRLRGRSPEEVERYIQLLEDANRDMNTQLNSAASRVRDEGPQQNEPDPIDTEYEETPFLDDPDKKLSLFEKRIERMLDAAVSPFKQDAVRTQAKTARDTLRAQYDDFDILEPVIDKLLRQMGQNPETAGKQELERLYFTAVGYANKNGIDLSGARGGNGGGDTRGQGDREVSRQEPRTPVNPPNRRPSGAPPPPPRNQGGKTRELTESERRLAREWGMSKEEYLELQGADQSEVVEPGFSREDW